MKALVERSLIAASLFVEDHQVGGQAMHSPIGVGLQHLAHQVDLPYFSDGDQHQRQVAGNGVGPQACLPLAVICQPLGR